MLENVSLAHTKIEESRLRLRCCTCSTNVSYANSSGLTLGFQTLPPPPFAKSRDIIERFNGTLSSRGV